MSCDLVVEIGGEEIPDRLMSATLAQLKARTEEMLAKQRGGFCKLETMGTPRRLVLVVRNLADKTKARQIKIKGPPAKAAFDASGQPTPAALGFARSQGVEVSTLTQGSANGGQYVFALKHEPGRPAKEVLARELPVLIRSLSFTRPMRWGEQDLKFIRPIRWLLVLMGHELIEFSLGGIQSDRCTYGHRFLAPGPFTVADTEGYFSCLEKGYVILDPNKRRELIRNQGDLLAQTINGRVLWTKDLLEEVTFLVEYPTAFMGSFAKEYLDLPSIAVITPMQDHQRYFPVVNPDGDLLPYFIAVKNGTADHLDLVRVGNEKVLRARLADARFFFREDQKMSPSERVEGLRQVVFQEGLGTLHDKSRRLVSLARFLAKQVGLDQAASSLLQRAAYLAKTDLTTNMVNEFPELQGLMGREYALLAGEPEMVAEAIAEQYLPRFAEDDLPSTQSGALLAVADKIDTITGCFSQGLVPTGSEDPYGLRRLGTGSINIVLGLELDFSLPDLVDKATLFYQEQDLMARSAPEVAAEVNEFLTHRLRIALETRGIRYDVVDAVLPVLASNPNRAYQRAQLISTLREEPFFIDLVRAVIRVGNLARQAGEGKFLPELLAEPAELNLYERYQELEPVVPKLLDQGHGLEAIERLASLTEPVDRFFTDVMVMVEDQTVRDNRLALLKKIRDLALLAGDFSQLVSEP